MTRRVGILGGTFDPIHVGHLDLAAAAHSALALTSMILMPSHVPPHRPAPKASAFHRFAMVALAIANRPQWQASDMELQEAAHSYTSVTLQRLHGLGFEPEELFFTIGADAFKEISSWKDFPAILDKAHFCVVARPGFALDAALTAQPDLAARVQVTPVHGRPKQTSIVMVDARTSDVSATAVRARLAAGQPVEGLVPDAVARHIAQNGLYRAVGFEPAKQRD